MVEVVSLETDNSGAPDQTEAPENELIFDIVRASWQEISGGRKISCEVDGRLAFFL